MCRLLPQLVVVILVNYPVLAQTLPQERIERERLLLKNYAFCCCLAKSYPELDSVWHKDGTGSIYLQASNYYLSAFDSINALAKYYANRTHDDEGKIYCGFEGETLRLMKCLHFYNSAALDSLVIRLDKGFDYGRALRSYLDSLKNADKTGRKQDTLKPRE
jgi:hypothetical protein